MFTLAPEIQSILAAFAPLFTSPVWPHAQTLLIGAILCTGKRTVTSALRVMGLKDEKRFTNFHRVLNRSKWNLLCGSKILLGLLVALLPTSWPVIIAVDETIECRKGEKIEIKGCYRDAVRSSKSKVVHCFGVKWIAMMLIVPLPWAKRTWAAPFLTVPAPSKSANAANHKRHKTTVDWTCQMIKLVRRWIHTRAIVLVGDGAYAAVSLALCCAGLPLPVTLVSRLRLDAALYDFPPKQRAGKRGPKPKKGKKQLSLLERIKDTTLKWETIEVIWYDGITRSLEILSGVSLWYTPGFNPIAIKWVIVRDPKGQLRTEAFFSTNLNVAAIQIIRWFIFRWNIEVTFQELRTHLGFETQRQWSKLAIARTTPVLFGLFSIIVLFVIKITKDSPLPVMSCAWYKKPEATFSDVIVAARRHIWTTNYFVNSSKRPDISYLLDEPILNLIEQLCYAA